MKISKELADETPVCRCGSYVEGGDILFWLDGRVAQEDMWWVMCPGCHGALGWAHPYPKGEYMESLKAARA
jgi:hypothetical protein